jgi:ribonuclease R
MYVEGLVHITELGGEYFRFDEARQELRGERTGTRYAIGTRVRIQVSRVDLDGRKIDFRLVHEGEGGGTRSLPVKGDARESGGPAGAERFALSETSRQGLAKPDKRKRSSEKSAVRPKGGSAINSGAAPTKKGARKRR